MFAEELRGSDAGHVCDVPVETFLGQTFKRLSKLTTNKQKRSEFECPMDGEFFLKKLSSANPKNPLGLHDIRNRAKSLY